MYPEMKLELHQDPPAHVGEPASNHQLLWGQPTLLSAARASSSSALLLGGHERGPRSKLCSCTSASPQDLGLQAGVAAEGLF